MKLKITVHGVAYEVDVEVLDPGEGFAGSSPLPARTPGNRRAPVTGAPPPVAVAPPPVTPPPPGASPQAESRVASPIAGTVVEIKCSAGERIEVGSVVMVIEAMKMKTSISAPVAGRVKAVPVAAGDTVHEGQALVELETES